MRIAVLAFFLLSIIGFQAPEALATTGRQLLDDCTGKQTNQLACLYFIGGFVAGASEVYTKHPESALTGRWCEPPKVTWTQRREIVLNYIREDVRRNTMNAKNIILEAHQKVFACD